MAVKNFLKVETKEKLQQALKEVENPAIRERVLIFLLLNTGNTQQEVAEVVGCSVITVAYWWIHGDPEKRRLFKQKVEEYLRIAKESPERLQVWFWDESGFSLRVIRRKDWCKKGSRRKKRGDRRKGRISVMGD